ncbi:MAG TPA: peptidase C14, partial [Rhodospirillum rubrum]|nr:peptidase C14 [Rhodospirillum rubrum]
DSCHSAGMSAIEGAPRPRGFLGAAPAEWQLSRTIVRLT